jgi:CBS domain-containing protein
LLEAAKQMVKRNVGLLVVCNARDRTKFVGVVSERDIIKSIVAGKKLATHVDSISTTRVVTVRSTSDVAEAAKAMNKHKIRHVVVVDNRGRLTGVVSMRDLVGERATLAAILQSHEKEVFVGGD